jgi:Glycosyl transferase family 2
MSARISVVLAADHAGPGLSRCLRSLIGQAGPIEIIVAGVSNKAVRSFATDYAEVRFVASGEPLPKAMLLQRAIDQATGEIIVVTEPDCWFPPDWAGRLRQAHDSGFAVIGGAVEYGGAGTIAGWACFLADYGPFLRPAFRQVSGPLAGNHISYKRSALSQAVCPQRGYVKTFLLWDLERQGVACLFDPELVIFCAPHSRPWQFARRYYANAREFAAARAADFSGASRISHIATTPALPLLLLFRRVRAIWPKRKHRKRLLQSLPLIAGFVLCWSAGELAGYLRGRRS